ncbi:MAG: nuclear transport factor 2 family protein [Gammaproteobacteria bacterium]|nr:nuclear transport factor 2 family protein [Gammaproteobacteria bacterium]
MSSNDRAALEKLVIDFTDAFNRDDLDEVMSYFADDAIYDEFSGKRHNGKEAIREAFVPQFRGDFGRIRFHAENMLLDVDSGQALISWMCTLETADRAGGWRGLDILHFVDGQLTEKHTYAKTKAPMIVNKDEMAHWPVATAVADKAGHHGG